MGGTFASEVVALGAIIGLSAIELIDNGGHIFSAGAGITRLASDLSNGWSQHGKEGKNLHDWGHFDRNSQFEKEVLCIVERDDGRGCMLAGSSSKARIGIGPFI